MSGREGEATGYVRSCHGVRHQLNRIEVLKPLQTCWVPTRTVNWGKRSQEILIFFSKNSKKVGLNVLSLNPVKMMSLNLGIICVGLTGLPRLRENMKFGCSFFQTGKTQRICLKY